MKTINSDLLAEQKKLFVDPNARVFINEVSFSDYLIGYIYRERSNQVNFSEVYLDNSSGYFNDNPPVLGQKVWLSRGALCNGTRRYVRLPEIYIEELEYEPGMLTLHCIDYWGKLRNIRMVSTQVWSSEDIADIIDDILAFAGLTTDDSVTSLTLDFQVGRNARADQALRRLCSKIPEHPYAGNNGVMQFKELDSSEASVYTYGWQDSNHNVREVSYTTGLWKYNYIWVYGALDGSGDAYSGAAINMTQVGLGGLRYLVLRDPTLTSDAQCTQRAEAELDYYEAAAMQVNLIALPCHGLELYDMITLATTPWGDTSLKVRVKSYIERYGPGVHEQEIQLLSPESDVHVEPAEIPDWLIEDDTDTGAKIGPAALNAYQVIGSVVRGTDAQSDYDTAAKVAAEFIVSAGRAASVGDALLVWNDDTSEWRLYIYEATDPEWVYLTIDGSVT